MNQSRRGPQRQRRPGGGFGGSGQEQQEQGGELQRPETADALSEIERALATQEQQEQRSSGCGCW